MDDEDLRKPVRDAVADYFAACHAPRWDAPFVPGETFVPVSGKVYDGEDMATVMEAVLDFWLTTGRFAHAFEKSFSEFLDVRHTLLCNSGSSANLLALACLTSPKLKERRLQPGDEVITLAAGFPIAVRPEAPFTRRELIRHLDQAKIDTRLLFGGNLTRQPAFREAPHRKIGDLKNSDFVMNQVFWIGVYPGLSGDMLAYVMEMFIKFSRKK